MTPTALRDRFRRLHERGTFVMPNPFDVGSARLLEALGFPALATTSSGLAGTLGRLDMTVTTEELVAHVAVMARSIDLPLSVDGERCYAEDLVGVAAFVEALADCGAAGLSIEDYNPATGRIDPMDLAADRVASASEAANISGMVLTARCENHLHGVEDLDDTIARLRAYADAGAGCVYAPGLSRPQDIRRVVDAVDAPVNVLLIHGVPPVSVLAGLGVRRVSVGGRLARIAMGAVATAAVALRDGGDIPPGLPILEGDLLGETLGPR